MARIVIPEPKNGAAPTTVEEQQVLEGLYGPPDPSGVYRGDSPADGGRAADIDGEV